MYIQDQFTLQASLAAPYSTSQPVIVVSYNEINSSGMVLPQSTTQALLDVGPTIVLTGISGSALQVAHLNVCNADTSKHTVTLFTDDVTEQYKLVSVELQPGETLEWSRDIGWQVLSGAGAPVVVIQEYTAGTSTWSKPNGLKRVLIAAVGAGGGGGSGRRGAAASNRFGGGGGGGGAVVWRQVAADDLTSAVTVTVATGGTGGAGAAADDTNGNNGNTAADTSFGSIVIAKGGLFGSGGTASVGTAGTGGQTFNCTPFYGPYAMGGGQGSAGATGNPGQATFGFSGGSGTAGGGGGGGINSSNANSTAGGQGGGVYLNGLAIAGPTSGASPNGVANQSNFLLFSTSLTSGKGIGTGGAGGFPPTTAAGNGGNYGAGGGGGRASVNGTASGAGGNGGDGLVLVMEIY
jgi:hypothetical protein